MVVECDTSIAINYCYFAQLQQRAVNSQLLEGSMKPSWVEHNVFTVRHQFALKSLDDQRRSLCVPECSPMIKGTLQTSRMDSYTGKTECAFVVLMKRHNLTPLSIPGEEVTWYSGYASLTDGEPKWQGSGFHSSPAETNEEFVARRNRRKRNNVSFTSVDCLLNKIIKWKRMNANMREIKGSDKCAKLSYW